MFSLLIIHHGTHVCCLLSFPRIEPNRYFTNKLAIQLSMASASLCTDYLFIYLVVFLCVFCQLCKYFLLGNNNDK